jgi:hypothetical protein
MFMLNLTVCPAAACLPISSAKVPLAIAKLAARPAALGVQNQQFTCPPASGRISGNQYKGTQPCISQTSISIGNSARSHPLAHLRRA